MNEYLSLDLTDIIKVYGIVITCLTYLLQGTTDFSLHFYFSHFYCKRLMRKFFV